MPYHKQKEINSNTLLNNMNFKSLVTLLFISHLSFVIAQEVSGELGDGISNTHNLFSAIDNDDVSCYRIPALITANNGDLLVAIDERIPSCGDLKWSEDINIVLRKSTDNGVSWLPIERKKQVSDFKHFGDPEATNESYLLQEHCWTFLLGFERFSPFLMIFKYCDLI